MSYYLYGVGAVVLVGVAVSIGGSADTWQPVNATISTIDRKCQIIETKYDSDYNGTPLTLSYTATLDDTGKFAGTVEVQPFGVSGDFTATAAAEAGK